MSNEDALRENELLFVFDHDAACGLFDSSVLLSIAGLLLAGIAQSGRGGSDGCEGGVTFRMESVGELDVEEDTRRPISELIEDRLALVEPDRTDSVFGLLSSKPAAELLLLIECPRVPSPIRIAGD